MSELVWIKRYKCGLCFWMERLLTGKVEWSGEEDGVDYKNIFDFLRLAPPLSVAVRLKEIAVYRDLPACVVCKCKGRLDWSSS